MAKKSKQPKANGSSATNTLELMNLLGRTYPKTSFSMGNHQAGNEDRRDVSYISTGSLLLDFAIGGGTTRAGSPTGRIVEIFGPESSGKTTIALNIIANAQAMGYSAAFIDAEHALDVKYAANLGVNTEELLISQPDSAEQALGVMDTATQSGLVNIVVLDSVAALAPQAELDGAVGDSHVGIVARLMSQTLRKISFAASTNGVCLIFINQIREKIGIMFGNPETTPGGRALRFYSSLRLDVRRIGTNKDGADAVSNQTRVKVIKNKLFPPYREAEFEIEFGKGISYYKELLDFALKHGAIEKSGAWYSFNGERLGQGRENSAELLKQTPELTRQIELLLNLTNVEEGETINDYQFQSSITDEEVDQLETPQDMPPEEDVTLSS